MNRKTTGILAIFACFFTGAIVGVCGHALWLKYETNNQERPILYALGGRDGDLLIQRLVIDLQLTQDQEKQLEFISKESQQSFREFFNKNRPIMEGLVENFEKQTTNILTEEQKTRFYELQKRQHRMMRIPPPPHHNHRRHSFKDPQNIDSFFTENDTNKNDFIDSEEIPPYLKNRFARIDKNDDGKLSKEEIITAEKRRFIGRNQFFQEKPPPPPTNHHIEEPPPPPDELK